MPICALFLNPLVNGCLLNSCYNFPVIMFYVHEDKAKGPSNITSVSLLGPGSLHPSSNSCDLITGKVCCNTPDGIGIDKVIDCIIDAWRV